MALIVNSIKFKNIDFSIENVYVRLHFVALPNGKTLGVHLTCFENKDKFVELKPLDLDFPLNVTLECGVGQQQTLQVAHELAKTYLENLEGKNYIVTIDLT